VRKILIIGVGGIGSFLVPILDMTKLYNITVYDPDKVEKKNITYQNFTEEDISSHKVSVMKRLPSVKNAKSYPILTAEQITGYDLVICCADNLTVRRLLYRSDVKWLDLRAQGRNCALISYEMDTNLFDTVLSGPDGSFSCQGTWDGKAKNVHFMQTVAAGMGAQWMQRWFNDEEVCKSKVMNI
jgi:molybdopterin/thiamine biosynthesis adenylyltransferase